jgi:protocatechuate 3,4-dioxygenase beta subunit
VGTLKRRLEHGRKLLHARLSRRGLTLSAVLPAMLLGSVESSASLAESTARAATSTLISSASVPASVAILVQNLSSSIKTKIVWGLVLLFGACAGTGVWAYRGQSRAPTAPSAEPRTPAATAKSHDPPRPVPRKRESSETITVTGQVLDPNGKPLTATRVTVLAGIKCLLRSGGLSKERKVLAEAETNREGRFGLMVPRTSSLQNWEVDLVASHAGYGLAWQSFDADAAQPTITVRLPPERILRGRLIDLRGQPVAGAKLKITRVNKGSASIALDNSRHMEFVWPKPIVTDKNGQFLIHGIGESAVANLLAEHGHCAPQRLELADDETKTFVLAPARLLEGRVLYADTNKPAAHLEVGAWGVRAETDEHGWFRLNPTRGPIRAGEEIGLILAYAPQSEPYLNVQKEFGWPKVAATGGGQAPCRSRIAARGLGARPSHREGQRQASGGFTGVLPGSIRQP